MGEVLALDKHESCDSKLFFFYATSRYTHAQHTEEPHYSDRKEKKSL